jgi:hypothetical protein
LEAPHCTFTVVGLAALAVRLLGVDGGVVFGGETIEL